MPIYLFPLILLCFVFAEGPQVSVEACIGSKNRGLIIVTKLIILPSTMYIRTRDTLCCNPYESFQSSSTVIEKQDEPKESRCERRNFHGITTRTYSEVNVILPDSIELRLEREEAILDSTHCGYKSGNTLGIDENEYLRLSEAYLKEPDYPSKLFGQVVPYDKSATRVCGASRTILNKRFYIRLTGPCSDSLLKKNEGF